MRRFYRGFAVALRSCAVALCFFLSSNSLSIAACSPSPNDFPNSFLHSFEDSTTEGAEGTVYTIHALATNRLELDSTLGHQRQGSKGLKFTTDGTNNSDGHDDKCEPSQCERTELRMNAEYSSGEQWWAHSTFFPDNFQFPPADPAVGDNWSLFAQWHGSEPPNPGQGAPNLASLIKYEGGRVVMRFRRTNATGEAEEDALDGNPPDRNVWYDFVYHVNWSSGTDGFVRIWVRKPGDAVGKLIMDVGGATLYPGKGVYFKIGTYHAKWDGTPSSVIHDCVAKGSSVQQVAWFPLQGVPETYAPLMTIINSILLDD